MDADFYFETDYQPLNLIQSHEQLYNAKMETSLEIYLNYTPGEIISTDKVVDVGCGMYPCYYVQQDSEVMVSTSGANLISKLGNLNRNSEFKLPESFSDLGAGDEDTTRQTIIERLAQNIPAGVRQAIPEEVKTVLESLGIISRNDSQTWTKGWHTIDSRISRLRPFETVTADRTEQNIDFTKEINQPKVLVKQTAKHMTSFIHRIENQFPEHQHIILTGGMDSQLISLVPKQTNNWHIFSAEPNYPVVAEFVEKNNIDVKSIVRHSNENEETVNHLQEKLIASDLMTDPRHLRWRVSLRRLVNDFDGDCIIWSGTAADAIYTYFSEFHDSYDYFDVHLTRVASWQAISHQVTENFVGVPQLSPYHSAEIWENVYRHYDPGMMSPGMDLRPKIGDHLSDEGVWWPNRNPSPTPYNYEFEFDPLQLFLDGIQSKIDSGQSQS